MHVTRYSVGRGLLCMMYACKFHHESPSYGCIGTTLEWHHGHVIWGYVMALLWLRYGYVVAVATIAASAKTEAVLWLPCQLGENKRVCSCYGSAFSSSLLACALPSLRSANNVHSAIQQDHWHHEQDWRYTGKMQSDNK